MLRLRLTLSAAGPPAAASAATPTAPASGSASASPSTGPPSSTELLACRNGWSIDTVEIRFILFIELDPVLALELLAAFDEDSALIRTRLALIEFVAWPRRRRDRWRRRSLAVFGLHRSGVRQFRLLLFDQRLAA